MARRSFVRPASLGVALATLAVVTCVHAVRAENVTVPAGVKIPAELTAQVTSLTAHVGDTFAFKTSKDETLGTVRVPAGTPGHGRIATVVVAHGDVHGSLALQADSLDLPGGGTIWVNVDNSRPLRGHLSDRHTKWKFAPIPIGIVPIVKTTVSGNLVLDAGSPFTVITILPRKAPAPLMTAAPTPEPAPSATATPPGGGSPSP